MDCSKWNVDCSNSRFWRWGNMREHTTVSSALDTSLKLYTSNNHYQSVKQSYQHRLCSISNQTVRPNSSNLWELHPFKIQLFNAEKMPTPCWKGTPALWYTIWKAIRSGGSCLQCLTSLCFFSDVIQAIFFFDLWKRYQVCREVDSPGQSGSGNQDLGPRPVVIDHNTFCVSEKHRISYDNLYSCIRSKSVNCQIVVIFQWQWTYMTWNKKQLVLCQRTRISSKCGSTYINLLSNFAWAGSFLIMLHHSSASINHP